MVVKLITSKKEGTSDRSIDLSYHSKIIGLLEHSSGLTITQISQMLGIARNTVVVSLARLDGAGKVNMKKIGMAKVYSLKSDVQTKLMEE